MYSRSNQTFSSVSNSAKAGQEHFLKQSGESNTDLLIVPPPPMVATSPPHCVQGSRSPIRSCNGNCGIKGAMALFIGTEKKRDRFVSEWKKGDWGLSRISVAVMKKMKKAEDRLDECLRFRFKLRVICTVFHKEFN